MRKLLLLSIIAIIGIQVKAQEAAMLNGRVLSSDSLAPLASTHIISRMGRIGTISDYNGYFHLHTHKSDTLYISSIGFEPVLVAINPTTFEQESILVLLNRDTIMLDEVEVRAFYDYRTFKHMIINMPIIEAPTVFNVSEELAKSLIGLRQREGQEVPIIQGLSPIQALYDAFNKKSRLQRRIMRNRKIFNDILREEGRLGELLPDSLEYMTPEEQ